MRREEVRISKCKKKKKSRINAGNIIYDIKEKLCNTNLGEKIKLTRKDDNLKCNQKPLVFGT